MARNFRLGRLEGDLLFADDARNCLVFWEVRGRTRATFRPAHMLTPQKKQRLIRLATWVAHRSKSTVRLQLLELVGVLPNVQWRVFDIE